MHHLFFFFPSLIFSLFPHHTFSITPITTVITAMLASATKKSFQRRLYSTINLNAASEASPTPNKSRSMLKQASKVFALFTIAYGSGIYYASVNEKFNRPFVKYVPLAGKIIDFLEEREYQNNIAARARRMQLEKEAALDTFYYRRSKVTSKLSTKPPVSSVTSAIDSNNSASSSADTKSNATSALSSTKDPLSPKRFFDAVSGTVGEDRDYLPLVLLPDDQDKYLNKAAMSLNELISSFNSSAISEDTMLSVSQSLATVAKENATVAPHYAQVIMHKSQEFDRLYRSYRLIWDEYLDNQSDTTFRSNPVLHNYSRKLAEEITETEMLLVNLINSGRNGNDLSPSDAEYVKFKDSRDKSKKKIASAPALPHNYHNSTEALNSAIQPAASGREAKEYGGFDGSDVSLQLRLTLTLLVSALQQHSSVPLSPYIEGVREAVAPYQDLPSKEKQIQEALKTISIPDDVDLQPVIHDILSFDKK